MFTVTAHQDSALSRNEMLAVVMLLNSIWPSKDKTTSDLVDDADAAKQRSASRPQHNHPSIRYLIWDGRQLVAHALTFGRMVLSITGPIPVMALAGVCVAVSHRGLGLGVDVVRHAFKRIDEQEFPVALFQTAIPSFYERLGATPIRNRFINSNNTAAAVSNPWHDPWVMIYSIGYLWPDGLIDLNGPGY